MREALARHWPEYLMEATGLGLFLISACLCATLLEYPGSPVRQALADPLRRRALMGLAMGLTAMAIIYSPWGKQSGAHINPAVTFSFWYLGKIGHWDAIFYIAAQLLGAVAGVAIVAWLLGPALADPQVNYIVTLPGEAGVVVAFAVEMALSFGLFTAVLIVSNDPKRNRYTGWCAGLLVALYITFTAPFSGMSINPARSFGSAFVAGQWHDLWLYLLAPPLGMLLAAEIYHRRRGRDAIGCCKLHHENDKRCIFRCNYRRAIPSPLALCIGSEVSLIHQPVGVTPMSMSHPSHTEENLPSAVIPTCPNQLFLRGQKALVTGAGSGIGKQIAIALGNAGADVIINYAINPEQAQETVAEIQKQSGMQAVAVQADVADEDQVRAMFRRMFEEFGTIDILVNNAGLQKDAPFEELKLKDWNRVINVNLTGQFLCTRAAVREFKRRGVVPSVSCAAGKIICISSVHDVIPWAGHVNYAASKGGVMMMMKSIAQEVAPYRIRVNSISPGAIRTPINMQAWDTPEAYNELLKLIPYKRIGEPAEIGRVAVWLASDYSDYITGATLYVDGGMTLYPGFETGG